MKFTTPYDHEFAGKYNAKADESIKDGFLFFWHGWLAQWYFCRFEIDGILYNCAEQYMMAEKARLFNDDIALNKILCSPYPKAQKALGRQVNGFDEKVWNEHAREIVFRGNLAKFSQDSTLKSRLLNTGELRLVEASPYDRIWGIGLGVDSLNITDTTKWRGTNWLGLELERVREKIK